MRLILTMDINLENDDYFLCSWNGTDITQIHTKESLIKEYKKTGLFEDKSWFVSPAFLRPDAVEKGISSKQKGYGTIIDLMDYHIRRQWPFQAVYNDNMTIMYIKMKDNTDHDNDKKTLDEYVCNTGRV